MDDDILSSHRREEWLKRSFSWNIHEEDDATWQPIRVLGQGGFGICGQWEVTNKDGSKNFVAVKQIGWHEADRATLQNESEMLNTCHSAKKTDHIVQLFKLYHTARGTGTHPDIDPHERNKAVGRMYLEYCEDGDMYDYLRNIENAYERGYQLPEEEIWRLWQCLSKALLILDRGAEDEPQPNWRSIIHFDIKPENILITKKSIDPNLHKRSAAFKLADFGIAKYIPDRLNTYWHRQVVRRGTSGYLTPEQVYYGRDKADITVPANIFGIALCIYQLLVPRKRLSLDKSFMVHLSGQDQPGFKAYGQGLLGEWGPPYSKTLISVLLNCLAHDPGVRPTASQLDQMIETGVDFYDNESRRIDGNNPSFDNTYGRSALANFDVTRSPVLHTEPPADDVPGIRVGARRRVRDNVTASGRSFEPVVSDDGT